MRVGISVRPFSLVRPISRSISPRWRSSLRGRSGSWPSRACRGVALPGRQVPERPLDPRPVDVGAGPADELGCPIEYIVDLLGRSGAVRAHQGTRERDLALQLDRRRVALPGKLDARLREL